MSIADFFNLPPRDQLDVLYDLPLPLSLYEDYTGQFASAYTCSDTAGRLKSKVT